MTFAVLWREPQTAKQTSMPFDSETEARNFLRILAATGDDLSATQSIMKAIERRVPTIRDLITEHIDGLSSANARTRADYRRDALAHIVPELGHVAADELTQDRVRHWVRRLAASDLADKTIRGLHSLLSAAMTTAVERGYRTGNPCRGVKLPRRREDHDNVSLTRDQWIALRAELGQYVGGWYLPLYDTLIATGMRWGEATALEVSDLQLGPDPVIRVTKAVKRDEHSKAYVGTTKTAASRRTVPVPRELANMLREHVAGKRAGDLVFPGPMGGRILSSNARARAWMPAVRAVQAAGILPTDVTPRQHDLRHTYATWQIAGGTDLLTVQRIMGHENISTTTKTYATVMPAQARGAADVVGAMLRG